MSGRRHAHVGECDEEQTPVVAKRRHEGSQVSGGKERLGREILTPLESAATRMMLD